MHAWVFLGLPPHSATRLLALLHSVGLFFSVLVLWLAPFHSNLLNSFLPSGQRAWRRIYSIRFRTRWDLEDSSLLHVCVRSVGMDSLYMGFVLPSRYTVLFEHCK